MSNTKAPYKFTQAGIDLLEKWEGLRLTAYKDVGGVLTIGYGDTHNVTEGLQITKEEAVQRFFVQLQPAEKEVLSVVTYSSDAGIKGMTNNMYSALVCMCYNIGENAFENSTLADYLSGYSNITRGSTREVISQMLRWNKVKGQIVEGLTNRRNAEIALWNTPDAPAVTS